MKLQYRGLPYESTTQVFKTVKSGICAKYRGITYVVGYPINVDTPPASANLKYRGVLYTLNQSSTINPFIQPTDHIFNQGFI